MTDQEQSRIDRISNAAASMLKPDSPAQFVEAAINVAFAIDKKVTERVSNGE